VEIKGRVETQPPAWSASECASIHRSITEHLRRHDAEIAAIRAEAKADTDRVLSHVEEVRAELSGKMDDQAKEFGQAFRDMPNQIIALLRNTGALRK
jgi:predicted transcriptional regulator